MKKNFRTIFILLATFIMVMVYATNVFAGSTKLKNMTYHEVYKTGSIVYCNDYFNIFKVNLETGEVTKLTTTNESGGPSDMKLYKGYIYFEEDTYFSFKKKIDCYLSRVSTSGKSYKKLSAMFASNPYVIKGSKIYYRRYHNSSNTMSLNGNNKKKVKWFDMDYYSANTNVKGYRIITDVEEMDTDFSAEHETTYLRKADGEKIKLADYYYYDYGYHDEMK